MTLVQFWTKFRLEPPGSDSDGGDDLVYALRKEEFEVTPEEEAFCKNITASLVNLHLNFPEIEWIRKKNVSCRSRRTKFVCHVQTGDYDALGKGKSAKEAILDGLESLEYFLPSDEENEPCQFPDFGELDDNCKRTSPFHSPIKIVSVPNAKEYSEDINTTFTKEILEDNATFTKEPVCSAAVNFFNEFLEQAGDDVVDHGPSDSKEKDLDIGSNLGGIAGEGEHGDLVFNPFPDLSSSPIKDYVCMPENDKPSGVVESDEESNVSGPTSSVEFEFEPELDRIHGFNSQCAEGKESKAPEMQQEYIFNYDKEDATTFTVLPPECLSKSEIIYGVPELLTLDPMNLRFGGLSPILEEDSQLVPVHQLPEVVGGGNVACGTFIIRNELGDEEESPVLDHNAKDAECETFVLKIEEDSHLVPPPSHDNVLEVDSSTTNLDNEDAECGTYVVEVENEPRDMVESEPSAEFVEVQDSLPPPAIPEVVDAVNDSQLPPAISEIDPEGSPQIPVTPEFEAELVDDSTPPAAIPNVDERDYSPTLAIPKSDADDFTPAAARSNVDAEDTLPPPAIPEILQIDVDNTAATLEILEVVDAIDSPSTPAIPEFEVEDSTPPALPNVDAKDFSPAPAMPEFEVGDSTPPAPIPNLDAKDSSTNPAVPESDADGSTTPITVTIPYVETEDTSSLENPEFDGEDTSPPPAIPEILQIDVEDTSLTPAISEIVDAADSPPTPALPEYEAEDSTHSTSPAAIPECEAEDSTSPAAIPNVDAENPTPLATIPNVDAENSTSPATMPNVDAENSTPPATMPDVDAENSTPPAAMPNVDAENSTPPAAIPNVDAENSTPPAAMPNVEAENSTPPAAMPNVDAENSTPPAAIPNVDAENATPLAAIPNVDTENTSSPAKPEFVAEDSSLTPAIPEVEVEDSSPTPGIPEKPEMDVEDSTSSPTIPEAVNKEDSLEEGELPATPLRSEHPCSNQVQVKFMAAEPSGALPVTDLEPEPFAIPQIDAENSLPPPPAEILEFDAKNSSPIPEIQVDAEISLTTPAISEVFVAEDSPMPPVISKIDAENSLLPPEISEFDAKDSSLIPEIKVDAKDTSSPPAKPEVDVEDSTSPPTPTISEAGKAVYTEAFLEEGELPMKPLRNEDSSSIKAHAKVLEAEPSASSPPPVTDLETEPFAIPQIDTENSLPPPPVEILELDAKDSSPIPEIQVDAEISSTTPAISEVVVAEDSPTPPVIPEVDVEDSTSPPTISEAGKAVYTEAFLEDGELPTTPLKNEDPSSIKVHAKVLEAEPSASASSIPPVTDLETEPFAIPQIDAENSLPPSPAEILELDAKDSSPIPEIQVDAEISSTTHAISEVVVAEDSPTPPVIPEVDAEDSASPPTISEAAQAVHAEDFLEEGELPATPLRSEDPSSIKAQSKVMEAEPSTSAPPPAKDLEKELSGKPSDHEAHAKPERGRRSGSSRGRRGAWRGRPYQYQW